MAKLKGKGFEVLRSLISTETFIYTYLNVD